MRRRQQHLHRRRPIEDLAGVDDGRVTAPAIEQDLALKVVRLSDVNVGQKKEERARTRKES